MDLVLEVRVHQVTLVPDADDALTSNAGWILKHGDFLKEIIAELKKAGIRTSVFLRTGNGASKRCITNRNR